jgi:lipopolysaccharide export system protein LptA
MTILLKPAMLGAALFAAALPAGSARAEQADRDKPLVYEAASGECDDLQQVCVLVGDVVLVKGSLRATGDRVQIRKDPEGYQYGVIQGAPGRPATFRQRRDPTQPGVEETIEGTAERIEYDEKADTVKLISRARVRLLANEVQRDELSGDAITYDQRNAKYFVTGGKASGDQNNPDGRVRGTIAPRTAAAPGGAAPLKPATRIENPRRD